MSSIYAESGLGGIYGVSKLCAELILEEFSEINPSLNYNIIRLGTVYGGESSASNGLHKIVQNALENRQVWFTGPLHTAREYIHIKDVSRCLTELAKTNGKIVDFLLKGNSLVKMTDLCLMLEEYLGLEKGDRIEDSEYDGHYAQIPFRQQKPISTLQY